MGYPIHPLSNVGVAGQYLNQLNSDNISQRYFSGQQTYTGGFLDRLKLFFSIDGTINELNNFYPYVPIVKATKQSFQAEKTNALANGILVTAFSWFTIFNLARRGRVLPFLNQYDRFFKTHRLFRQYLYTLVLPTTIFVGLVDFKYLNHTEHLWDVHARRMNQKITADPENSEYPEELLPTTMIGSWVTPYQEKPDLKKKWANQTELLIAPDYVEPAYEIQEFPSEEAEGEEGEEEEEQ